jgi:hypothetical protein
MTKNRRPAYDQASLFSYFFSDFQLFRFHISIQRITIERSVRLFGSPQKSILPIVCAGNQKIHSEVISRLFSTHMKKATQCSRVSVCEHCEEMQILDEIKVELESLLESEDFPSFLLDIRSLFDTIYCGNFHSFECLREIMIRAGREEKKLEKRKAVKYIDENTLEERKNWPRDLAECLRDFNERAKIIDEIRWKISSYKERVQKEDDFPSLDTPEER